MKHLLLSFLLAMVTLSFSFAQQYNFAAIDNLLNTNLTSAYNGKVVCMIYRADTLLYYKALGGFDSTSTALIASATKNFSGVLMLKLAQEGHFKLDDTIGKYLPLATRYGKGGSTIRQNFSHTAGWSGTSGEEFLAKPGLTLAQTVDSILVNDPYTYAPGTRFRYTGVSMQVAARCAEIATGQSWNTLFQTKIAQPLGLKNTVYQLSGANNPRVAGGISSSPADIIRFLKLHLNNGKVGSTQVIDSVWMQELWKDQTKRVPQISSPYPESPRYNNPFNQDTIYYGIGDWLDIYNPQRNYVEQISGAGAFGTIYWVNRCNGTFGVVFTSSSYSRALGTTFQIMDVARNAVGTPCYNLISTADRESVLQEKINVYPNPTKGQIQIELPILGSKKVTIFNIQGQRVQVFETNENAFAANITTLPDGIYNMRITTSDGRIFTQTIVKQ